jgi:hypothetical protein
MYCIFIIFSLCTFLLYRCAKHFCSHFVHVDDLSHLNQDIYNQCFYLALARQGRHGKTLEDLLGTETENFSQVSRANGDGRKTKLQIFVMQMI